ncbi:hypothetical protein MMC09_006753 [Bachmanniomyces sp. S44760]|nr:hypothetical protein [Bachmanniomyces sp. S44760]
MSSTPYSAVTPRLILQELDPLNSNHLKAYHGIWSNPDNLLWSTQAPKTNLEDARAWMINACRAPERPDVENFAILLKQPKRSDEAAAKPDLGTLSGEQAGESPPPLIGFVGVIQKIPIPSRDTSKALSNRHQYDPLPATTSTSAMPDLPEPLYPELGYCLDAPHCNQGYASEAVSAFLELYWTTINPSSNVMLAKADVENRASRRILEKNGFVVKWVIERDFKSHRMGWRNMVLYQLTK